MHTTPWGKPFLARIIPKRTSLMRGAWNQQPINQTVYGYRNGSTAEGTDDWDIADDFRSIGSGALGSFIMARALPSHRGCDTRRRVCRASLVHRSGELKSKGCAHPCVCVWGWWWWGGVCVCDSFGWIAVDSAFYEFIGKEQMLDSHMARRNTYSDNPN